MEEGIQPIITKIIHRTQLEPGFPVVEEAVANAIIKWSDQYNEDIVELYDMVIESLKPFFKLKPFEPRK